jgi:hypothetical protein
VIFGRQLNRYENEKSSETESGEAKRIEKLSGKLEMNGYAVTGCRQ